MAYQSKTCCRVQSISRNLLLAVGIILGTQAAVPLPAHAVSADIIKQAAKYRELGDQACDDKNFGLAVSSYTKALSLLPYDAAQNMADLYYARAIANDVSGQYQRATNDWQAARDNYAKALLGNRAGVNVPFATSYKEELTDMLAWRAAQNPNSPDYLESVSSKRFAPGQTIQVYIDSSEKNGFAPDLRAMIFQAMNQWCTFSGSPIRMQLHPSQYGANIVVKRAAGATEIGVGASGHTDANSIHRSIITRSNVNLSAAEFGSKDMSPRAKEKLYNLALHETGHALGIDGHSPSGLDVMYFKSPLIKLSDRDASTIRKIYQP